MASAMGDIVMTPLYEVLRARGVKFEFFSKVSAIHPTEDGSSVASVDLIQQAVITDGEYLPLRTIGTTKKMPCVAVGTLLGSAPRRREAQRGGRELRIRMV